DRTAFDHILRLRSGVVSYERLERAHTSAETDLAGIVDLWAREATDSEGPAHRHGDLGRAALRVVEADAFGDEVVVLFEDGVARLVDRGIGHEAIDRSLVDHGALTVSSVPETGAAGSADQEQPEGDLRRVIQSGRAAVEAAAGRQVVAVDDIPARLELVGAVGGNLCLGGPCRPTKSAAGDDHEPGEETAAAFELGLYSHPSRIHHQGRYNQQPVSAPIRRHHPVLRSR